MGSPEQTPSLRIVAPAGLSRPTGGNHYDVRVAAALREVGVAVDVVEVAGRWPTAGRRGRASLAQALLSGPGPVLVDGLVGCGAPEEIEAAVTAGVQVHLLVHLPLALETGLDDGEAQRRDLAERRAVRAATGVVVPSAWAARELRRRHGRDLAVVVARPGTDPAPVAHGSVPRRLLHLASVTPVKDQQTVVAALGRLRDLLWTAHFTGDDRRDGDYATSLRESLVREGLNDRALVTGPLLGDDLEQAFAQADLLLLPSRVETWGLVVTEALARGIPVVVSAGTGSVEALAGTCEHAGAGVASDLAGAGVAHDLAGAVVAHDLAGAVVPPGDPDALAEAIRALLGRDRDRARAAALRRRTQLPGWTQTAQVIREALLRPIPAVPVDPDWLALREHADARARDEGAGGLLPALVAHLSERDPRPGERDLRLVDLGAGTGSNVRYLAPQLTPLHRQHWTTVDHDAALAVRAPVPVTPLVADVADLDRVLADLAEQAGGPVDLVSAAALLDLLDLPRLEAVVDAVVRYARAALVSLSVTGDVVLDPADPWDAPLAAAFDAHQRRDGRLGPDAGAVIADLFAGRGWAVTTASSPWRLDAADAADAALLDPYLAGRADAAAQWRPQDADPLTGWLDRRREQVAAGRLRVVVGHVDVLALARA